MEKLETVGFVNADIDIVGKSFFSWQRRVIEEYGMLLDSSDDLSGLSGAIRWLEPRTTPIRTRFAFVDTKGDWTAYLDNGVHGTDSASVLPVLSRELGCNSIRVVAKRDEVSDDKLSLQHQQYGATIIEIYCEDGVSSRSIFSVNDGGRWEHGQTGDPLDFEIGSDIGKKIQCMEFSAEVLCEYLGHVGVYPFSEEWYLDKVLRFEKQGKLPKSLRMHI